MSKNLKYLLIVLGILIVPFVSLILIGLHAMEIEDHYGDLQDVYYESIDNDIIIKETTKKFGIVNKSWNNIHLWTKEDYDIDLFNFAYESDENYKLKVFRFKKELLEIKQMNYNQIIELIKKEEPTLILEYTNK